MPRFGRSGPGLNHSLNVRDASFDWLKGPCFYSCVENIMTDHAIINSMENVRFGSKEGYFNILVFYGLFYERDRKHFPHVLIRYRNNRGSLGELEIAWKRSSCSYSGSPRNFHLCFCNRTENVFY